MHKLRSIDIAGFRGQQKTIKLRLKDDANFLIGRNGTGKTTLINLIHAALVVDSTSLRRANFETIILKFKKSGDKRVPTVTIKKSGSTDLGTGISYYVQDDSSSETTQYDLAVVRRRQGSAPQPPIRRPTPLVPVSVVRDRLSSIYKTTWLSLQRKAFAVDRGDIEFEPTDDEETDVDRRLDQVLNDLVRYFSRLDKLVSDKTQLFQKDWFLSSLATERSFSLSSLSRLNFEDERSALTSIFERFGMSSESYNAQIDKHFSIAKEIAQKVRTRDRLPIQDYLAVFDVMRLHSLVEQWQLLQAAQKVVYLPKTQFIEIASDMLYKKNILVNRSNQVTIVSPNNLPIPIRSLSSGEKQLLIFLSETLLQEQESYVFLADEPELSLHVEWQEELVPNLLKINPNAQVLFATHSPDIVNVYQKHIIEMESLIN